MDAMRRRDFLRSAGLLSGLLLARRAGARQAPPDSVAPPPLQNGVAHADTTAVIPDFVTLAVGGDTTPGYNLEAHFDQQVAAGVPKEALWPLYFAGIRPILEAADLAMVNLECTLTTSEQKLKKNFNFRARPELVEILKQGPVDICSLANNHMSDFGPDGVAETLTTLDRAGIEHFGAGENLSAARKPLVIERNGLRLGFLGYYFQEGRDMIEPREVYATARRPGVAGYYKALPGIRRMVREDVAELVPQVDVAIPYFHWGWEGHYVVRPYQRELAHLCVDLGCKAVLGAHPHRVQGVEVYKGAPIFYSLANFVYGGIKEPQDKLSMIARLGFSWTDAGAVRVDADVVPIQITRWPEAPFQPFVLEGPERASAVARLAELSAEFPATIPMLTAAPQPEAGASSR